MNEETNQVDGVEETPVAVEPQVEIPVVEETPVEEVPVV